MNRRDGGTAFPAIIPNVFDPHAGKSELDYTEAGMSLRDYAAIKAMAGEITRAGLFSRDAASIARVSYKIADAMIAERDK